MAKRKKEFFLRTAALMSSQGNKHLFKMEGIKFFKSSVSLAIQNFHQLSPHQSLSLMDVGESFTTKLCGRRAELTWKQFAMCVCLHVVSSAKQDYKACSFSEIRSFTSRCATQLLQGPFMALSFFNCGGSHTCECLGVCTWCACVSLYCGMGRGNVLFAHLKRRVLGFFFLIRSNHAL